MRWLPHLAVSTRLRLAFGLLAGLFAYIDHQLIEALPWVLLVMVLDLGASALAYLTVMSKRARRLQVFSLIVLPIAIALLLRIRAGKPRMDLPEAAEPTASLPQ